MIATAPPSEYISSLGGTPLISLIAFSATSRGSTFGFSGSLGRKTIDGSVGSAAASSFLGGGGAMYTSFSGGNSDISEKLVVFAALGALSAIIGSIANFGFSTAASSATPADKPPSLTLSACTEARTVALIN